MKKIIGFILVAILAIACSSKKDGNMIVEGNIKGLKKGTLYLQKMQDTVLVSVDSITVFGDGNFRLTDNVASPEIYYLTFNGNVTNKRILFFGNKGTITIKDNIELFGFNPEITGSKNQLILNDYMKINSKFQSQSLEFVKKEFDARKENNKSLLEKLEKDYQNMIKRRYLYTTNFAVTNANFEVAPYIALTELYDANIKLLDTINNSLSEDVKNSTYGKRLDKYIKEIKEKETENK
ncbi:DUF4369 domain-containing protein [Polaribacter batillariae]|uniref:DUF4369 domain-containing protein n=1 Tax=Polaribacter batillariae TaxID=2808900 RepID=A0ABX7SYY9_9FLAO|nr:DUF4369 domain-containing protein [Polaribacter batillariae]QTD38221.1 DUF4369 domain-containing protein [Polaribacter batillariae]